MTGQGEWAGAKAPLKLRPVSEWNGARLCSDVSQPTLSDP